MANKPLLAPPFLRSLNIGNKTYGGPDTKIPAIIAYIIPFIPDSFPICSLIFPDSMYKFTTLIKNNTITNNGKIFTSIMAVFFIAIMADDESLINNKK